MARFDCRHCREKGECAYRPGPPVCPRCGSSEVQIVVSIAEIPDDDPMWVDLRGEPDAWTKPAAVQPARKQRS